jgi:hypothetical protein
VSSSHLIAGLKCCWRFVCIVGILPSRRIWCETVVNSQCLHSSSIGGGAWKSFCRLNCPILSLLLTTCTFSIPFCSPALSLLCSKHSLRHYPRFFYPLHCPTPCPPGWCWELHPLKSVELLQVLLSITMHVENASLQLLLMPHFVLCSAFGKSEFIFTAEKLIRSYMLTVITMVVGQAVWLVGQATEFDHYDQTVNGQLLPLHSRLLDQCFPL